MVDNMNFLCKLGIHNWIYKFENNVSFGEEDILTSRKCQRCNQTDKKEVQKVTIKGAKYNWYKTKNGD